MNALELATASQELNKVINKYYWLEIDKKSKTSIIVYAIDGKLEYGYIRLTVCPVLGTGKFTVDSKRLEYIDNPTITVEYRKCLLYGNQMITDLSPYVPLNYVSNLAMEIK